MLNQDNGRAAAFQAIKKVLAGAPSQSVTLAKLRKAGFPPQSSNTTDPVGIANTGATNNWNDEETVRDQKPSRIGGFTDRGISATDSRITAAQNSASQKTMMAASFDAVKRDLSAPPRHKL